jgi:hypothetical protein
MNIDVEDAGLVDRTESNTDLFVQLAHRAGVESVETVSVDTCTCREALALRGVDTEVYRALAVDRVDSASRKNVHACGKFHGVCPPHEKRLDPRLAVAHEDDGAGTARTRGNPLTAARLECRYARTSLVRQSARTCHC